MDSSIQWKNHAEPGQRFGRRPISRMVVEAWGFDFVDWTLVKPIDRSMGRCSGQELFLSGRSRRDPARKQDKGSIQR